MILYPSIYCQYSKVGGVWPLLCKTAVDLEQCTVTSDDICIVTTVTEQDIYFE